MGNVENGSDYTKCLESLNNQVAKKRLPVLMIVFYPQDSDKGLFASFAESVVKALNPWSVTCVLAVHAQNVRDLDDDGKRELAATNLSMYTVFSNILGCNLTLKKRC